MNTLCFDFGNTRLKIAFFQNAKLAEVIVIENDEIATIGSILEKFDAQKTILSSVINHNPEIETLLAKKQNFTSLIIFQGFRLHTCWKTRNYRADRLALAAARFIFSQNNITW
jgi:type III pantothenate kinase